MNIKFNGRQIALPWNKWAGIEISPDGIHTDKGFIPVEAILPAIWRINCGRGQIRMIDEAGFERMLTL